jgi:uncharacterized RDD family membrane protein YckC
MEWYYVINGQQAGPIDEAEFHRLIAEGRIRAETLVWHAGIPDWQPLAVLQPAVAGTTVSDASAFCTECRRPFPAGELLAFQNARLCASCKGPYFQRIREQGTSAVYPAARYGGFWIRLLALIIDSIIIGAVNYPLTFAISAAAGFGPFGTISGNPGANSSAALSAALGLSGFLSLVIQVLYDSWFLVNRGATPGKMIFGLQVLRPDGTRLTWGRAVGRVFARLLSYFTFCIGFIVAGIDSQKRALHDFIVDSRVLYRK